jgi:sugar phosphate isomerase/epimerase
MKATTKLTRREWNKVMLTGLGGLFLSQGFASTGRRAVVIGIQTYSLRDKPLDEAIQIMARLGIRSCELWEGHVQPRELQWERNASKERIKWKRDELKKWRENVKMEDIMAIGEKLGKAGITVQAYNGSVKDSSGEDEIELVFKIAKALKTDTVTTSATVSVMKRVDVYAQKYKIKVGMHNHSHTDQPNEFSSPESFARAMQGLSDYVRINLDIGHFTAANFDAVDYLKQHHKKIVCIHVKDRKKDQGANLPLGQGDTPIAAVLRLIRDNNWPIPANIEYEYAGGDTETELKTCIAYCKDILKS